MTDYIVFIHGVNTRELQEQPYYAYPLFALIQQEIGEDLPLRMVDLYWGDIVIPQEMELLGTYQQSPLWQKLCFKDIREKQLLQFSGDAALYLSRGTGVNVVEELRKQLITGLSDYQPDDRLHLVTHSMGTVILFDMLFSSRWDRENAGGYTGVEDIRRLLFGLAPQRDQGIPLCSIHTMGSPISIYSLMMTSSHNLPTTHDITRNLREFLQALHNRLRVPIPWQNFIHPADPSGYPLAELLPQMLDESLDQIFNIEDILTREPDIPDVLWNVLGEYGQLAQLVLTGGEAHRSYWNDPLVAARIATEIRTVAQQVAAAKIATGIQTVGQQADATALEPVLTCFLLLSLV